MSREQVLPAQSPSARYAALNSSVKILDPTSARMVGRIERTGVDAVAVHRGILAVHFLGNNNPTAREMLGIIEDPVVIGPAWGPGQMVGSWILHSVPE